MPNESETMENKLYFQAILTKKYSLAIQLIVMFDSLADPNIKNRKGATPLHAAAKSVHDSASNQEVIILDPLHLKSESIFVIILCVGHAASQKHI